MNLSLILRKDGTVETPGVDFGGPSKVHLWSAKPLPIAKGSVIVLKIDGGSHWSGRGEPFRYHGVSFKIVEVEEINSFGEIRVKEIVEFSPRTIDPYLEVTYK